MNERDFAVPSDPLSADRQLSAATGSSNSHQPARKGKTMVILIVGIDLAKYVRAARRRGDLRGRDAVEMTLSTQVRIGSAPVQLSRQ